MRPVGFLGVALALAGLVAVAAADILPALPRDTLSATTAQAPIPLGLERTRPVPADNPLTDARVQLGRRLFFDPILSADGTVSCASCHQPDHGLASPQPRAVGVRGQVGLRNAPALFNRAYGSSFFWDGRAATLEAQALRPIADALELGSSVADVVQRLRADAGYGAAFQATFPDGVTADNLARALASFERTLLLGNSPVDRFRAGEVTVLSDQARQGLWLFESRGRCWRCHSGSNFTDEQFHNTGVSWEREPIDLGRYAVTKVDADRGRFKTPTLRGVARTAPYMHDGSLATLEDVVEFYQRGGGKNAYLDPVLEPLPLSTEDVRALVAFLRALSD
jgi:cytochrome c peroxidase